MMISTVRVNNFQLPKEAVEDEDAVHNDAVNSNWFSSSEVGEQQSY